MKIGGFVIVLAVLAGSAVWTGGTLPTAAAAPKDFDESPCPPAMANHKGDGRAKLDVKAVMTDNKMRGGAHFDAGDVKRLVIFTKWTPPVWSSHMQRVKLFAPG